MLFRSVGGQITIDRQWWEGQWRLNMRWAPAELGGVPINQGGTCLAYPQVTVQGRAYTGDGQTWLLENRYSVRSTDSFPGTDCAANRLKTLRWQDRTSGNWMEYERSDQSQLQFRLTRYGDRNDITVSLIYDSAGHLTEVRDHFANPVLRYTYTGDQVTAISDVPTTDDASPARSVRYTWTSLANPQGQPTPVITQVTDVLGNATRFGITSGRLESITDPEGRIQRYSYTADRVTKYTDAAGHITSYLYDYDKLRRIFSVRVTGPTAGPSTTEAPGPVTEVWYDYEGRLIRRDVNGITDFKRGEIDTASRSETREDALGRKTTLTRDEFGNLIKTQYPDGSSTSTAYSPFHGQPTDETNELGHKTHYDYDAKGNLTKKTEAVGLPEERITEYENDAYGYVIRETRKGRVESNGSTTADATWQYRYDSHGNLTQSIDPDGYNAFFVAFANNAEEFYVQKQVGQAQIAQFTHP